MLIDEVFCDICNKRAEFCIEEVKKISSMFHTKDGSVEYSDDDEELMKSCFFCRECFFNNEM